ncbi:NAD kinase [Brachybacterium timonense]|uniref:NAD kinase n=1 Tax=Brachybacterium timonense TaxID=2050896 RepID=UPI000D0B2DA6|nr:NAD kinase [Brachybacterium timonense]
MRRFLLFAHTGRRAALSALRTVLQELTGRGVTPVLVGEQIDEICAQPADQLPEGLTDLLRDEHVHRVNAVHADEGTELAIVLGGDGTILRALELVRDADVPVHGVNLGHVGFLAESEAEDLATTVARLLDGDYAIEQRSALEITVRDRTDAVLTTGWALNEASLEKSDRRKMVYAAVEIDGRPVSSFGCDGVLLSTSTGSTAYAFSAGGPVIWPEVDAMMLVPLAAHALFARPLVLGRSSEIAVELTDDDRDQHAVLTLDGRRGIDLTAGMRVEARLSQRSVRLVRLTATPFADRLVEKFELPVEGWRGRGQRQR